MIKRLFILLLFALFVYAGILFGTPYYHYYAFKSDVEELSKVSLNIRFDEMKGKVMSMANSYNIPLEEENITITRNDVYTIVVFWQETVNLLNIYERTFEFLVDTSS